MRFIYMYQYLPDVLSVQRKCYFNFLQEGLLKEIKSGLESVQKCNTNRIINSEEVHTPLNKSPIPITGTCSIPSALNMTWCTPMYRYYTSHSAIERRIYEDSTKYYPIVKNSETVTPSSGLPILSYTPALISSQYEKHSGSLLLQYPVYRKTSYKCTTDVHDNVNTLHSANRTIDQSAVVNSNTQSKAKIKLKRPTYTPDEALTYSRTYSTEVYVPVVFAAYTNIYSDINDVTQIAYGKNSLMTNTEADTYQLNTKTAQEKQRCVFSPSRGSSILLPKASMLHKAHKSVHSKGENVHKKIYEASRKNLLVPVSANSAAQYSLDSNTFIEQKNLNTNKGRTTTRCTWTALSWALNESKSYVKRGQKPTMQTHDENHTYIHNFKNALGKNLLSTSLHSETCKKTAYVSVGNFPLLTNEGSFVINGARRIIMNQIVRSPGIYYKMQFRSRNHRTYTISYVSDRGVWLRIERDKSDYIWVRINNYQKIPLFVFLRSLGITNEIVLNTITTQSISDTDKTDYEPSLWKSLKIGNPNNRKRALQYLGWVFRKGKKPLSVKQTREFLNEKLFHPRYYSFTKAGRLSINKKFNNVFHLSTLSPEDILLGLLALFKLELGETSVDDIDHLKNKRVRLVHELLQNQIRRGFKRLEEENYQSVKATQSNTNTQMTPPLSSSHDCFVNTLAKAYDASRSKADISDTWYYKKGYEKSDTFIKPNFSTFDLSTYIHLDDSTEFAYTMHTKHTKRSELHGMLPDSHKYTHNGLSDVYLSSNCPDTDVPIFYPRCTDLRTLQYIGACHVCSYMCHIQIYSYRHDIRKHTIPSIQSATYHHLGKTDYESADSLIYTTQSVVRCMAAARHIFKPCARLTFTQDKKIGNTGIIEKAKNLHNGKILCINRSNYTSYYSLHSNLQEDSTYTQIKKRQPINARLHKALNTYTDTDTDTTNYELTTDDAYTESNDIHYNVYTYKKSTEQKYYITKQKVLKNSCIYLGSHQNAYKWQKQTNYAFHSLSMSKTNENVILCEPIATYKLSYSAKAIKHTANDSTIHMRCSCTQSVNSVSATHACLERSNIFAIKIKRKQEFLKRKLVSPLVSLPIRPIRNSLRKISVKPLVCSFKPVYGMLNEQRQSNTTLRGVSTACRSTQYSTPSVDTDTKCSKLNTSFSFLHSSFCVPLNAHYEYSEHIWPIPVCANLNTGKARYKQVFLAMPIDAILNTLTNVCLPVSVSTRRLKYSLMQLHGSSYFKLPTVKNTQPQRLIQKADWVDYDNPKNDEQNHSYFSKFEKPVSNTLKEFFGLNPLSQFMDQINPLGELTQKRRLTSLGPGGVTREAGLAVRDIHPSYYGRICPIETPEGKNAGLVNSLSSHSHINTFGFIETGYIALSNTHSLKNTFASASNDHLLHDVSSSHVGYTQRNSMDELPSIGSITVADVSEKWDTMRRFTWLSSKEEEKYYVVPISSSLKEEGTSLYIDIENTRQRKCKPTHTQLAVNNSYVSRSTPDNRVTCRYNQSVLNVPPSYIDFSSVSSISIISIATSLIPFLEHDDGNRALMGSNMQRQGIPLLHSEKPIVGTGIESQAARDCRTSIVSKSSGIVNYADSKTIEICHKSYTQYTLPLFQRTNQNTLVSANPIVYSGDYVRRGDVIADTSSTKGGELSIGRNLHLGYMPWEGYNFEDAIVINEQVVSDHSLTSVHVEKIKITTDTEEEFFPPKFNTSEHTLHYPERGTQYTNRPEALQTPMLGFFISPNTYAAGSSYTYAVKPAATKDTSHMSMSASPAQTEHDLNFITSNGLHYTKRDKEEWLELHSLYLLYKYQTRGYYKETITLGLS